MFSRSHLRMMVMSGGLILAACAPASPGAELIFLDGRAATPAGDSIIAMTALGVPGVLLYDRRSHLLDTLGAGELASPAHVQWLDGRWYVSDVRDGNPLIIVFTADGQVERRVPLDTIADAPHQFAALEGGRLVVEGTEGRLLAIDGDSISLFALTQTSARTGLLVGAQGGVLHALPDKSVTLYNEFGKIRWQLEWPWASSAFAADLAVDSQGRAYLLAGEEGREGFVVFGFSPITGEIVRWSQEGPYATFAVRRLGEIEPDSAGRWLRGEGGTD